jgi:hypothetical protein
MRGLEDAPLALGLSRTIMVAGVCIGASALAHPFHALCRQWGHSVNAWGGSTGMFTGVLTRGSKVVVCRANKVAAQEPSQMKLQGSRAGRVAFARRVPLTLGWSTSHTFN